jgi:hypothetical protein
MPGYLLLCLQGALTAPDPAAWHPAEAVWFLALPDVQRLAPELGAGAFGPGLLRQMGFDLGPGSASGAGSLKPGAWSDWSALLDSLGAQASSSAWQVWLSGLRTLSLSVTFAPEVREAHARHLESGLLPAGIGDPSLYSLQLVAEFQDPSLASQARLEFLLAWRSWGGVLGAEDLEAMLGATGTASSSAPPASRQSGPLAPLLSLAPRLRLDGPRLILGFGGRLNSLRPLSESSTLAELRAAFVQQCFGPTPSLSIELLRQVSGMVPSTLGSSVVPLFGEDHLLDAYTGCWSTGALWRSLSVSLQTPLGWETLSASADPAFFWPREADLRLISMLPADPSTLNWDSLWPAARGFELERLLELGPQGLRTQFFGSLTGPLLASQQPRPDKDGAFAVVELALLPGADVGSLELALAEACDRYAAALPEGQPLHQRRGDQTVHAIRSPFGPRFALCVSPGRLVLGSPPAALLQHLDPRTDRGPIIGLPPGLFINLELDLGGARATPSPFGGILAGGVLASGRTSAAWAAGWAPPTTQRERFRLGQEGHFLIERLGPLPLSDLRQGLFWGLQGAWQGWNQIGPK